MISTVQKAFILCLFLTLSGCFLNDGGPIPFPEPAKGPTPTAAAPTASTTPTPPAGEEEEVEEGGATEEPAVGTGPSSTRKTATPRSGGSTSGTTGTAGGGSGGSGGGSSTGGTTSTLQDGDGDGIADGQDNCPTAANPDQVDADNDKVGYPCDNPNLISFTVTPTCLLPGGTVTVSWEATEVKSVSISSPSRSSTLRSCGSSRKCTGTLEIYYPSSHPIRTETFTLTARGEGTKSTAGTATVSIEERKFKTKFDKVVQKTGINGAAFTENEIYLATSAGLYRFRQSDKNLSRITALPEINMTSVAVDKVEPEILYATAKGHIYEFDGAEWDTIHVEDVQGNDRDVFSIAALDGHFAAGTSNGVYHGHLYENITATNLSSGSVTHIFAVSDHQFFAIRGTSVYNSTNGDNWGNPVLSVATPKFFEEVNDEIFLVWGGGAYQRSGSSWLYFDDQVDGPSSPIKAVGRNTLSGGLMVVAGSEVWLEPEAGSTWKRATVEGAIPEIKGFQYVGSGNYTWGASAVHTWTASEVPLSCAAP